MSTESPFTALEAERTVLGAILVDNATMPSAEDLLRPGDFADQSHRRIFAAMLALSERQAPIDTVTVMHELRSDDASRELPATVVAALLDGVPRMSSVEHWAGIVRDKARRRQAARLARELAEATARADTETEDLLDRHAAALQQLLDAGEHARSAMTMPQVLRLVEANLERFQSQHGVTGVPSGLPGLDRLTSGFQPGTLVIAAARPGQGKSVLCGQIAVHAASRGHAGLVFSMEMPPEQMVERMLLSAAELEKWDLRVKPEVANERIPVAMGRLLHLPLTFDRRESPTMSQIRAAAKRQHAISRLDFVVIDYLQRVYNPEPKVDNWIAVGAVARGLKSLARMLNVPVIVACQLNRGGAAKEPGLEDLAESGVIEREADVVMFLHPDPETKNQDLDFPVVHLIVGKHRGGACRRHKLSFEKRYTRFLELDRDQRASA